MDNFAAIDFETANNERTSICSVGVVIVRNGEIAVFRTYCMDYPDYDFYCTYQASRKLKGLRNHQLHTVAGFFGFELENHHHALADAEACAWIARQIL